MTMTDPIADLFTRIRNAQQVNHDRLVVPGSRIKEEICRILKETYFIRDYEVRDAEPGSEIEIELAYTAEGEPAIRRLRRVSRGGRRVYQRAVDLKPVLSGLGVNIVSTSQGLLTDAQARERGVGGEVLCEVW